MFIPTGNAVMGSLIGSRVYVATTAQVASQASYTFTDHAIGVAKTSRYIVVNVVWTNGLSLNRPLSGVTIAGNAATIHRQDVSPVNLSFRSAITGLAVAAGTTATIVASVSGGNAASCAISVYALYNLASTTPFAVNGAGQQSATSVSTTLNIPSRAIAIAAISNSGAGGNTTVSGLTEDVDVDYGGDTAAAASLERMTAETGRAISASGLTAAWAMSVASWA